VLSTKAERCSFNELTNGYRPPTAVGTEPAVIEVPEADDVQYLLNVPFVNPPAVHDKVPVAVLLVPNVKVFDPSATLPAVNVKVPPIVRLLNPQWILGTATFVLLKVSPRKVFPVNVPDPLTV